MATTKQKQAAGRNLVEARTVPLVDARPVRNAIACLDHVAGVTDRERDQASGRIVLVAKNFEVEVSADTWRELRHTTRNR